MVRRVLVKRFMKILSQWPGPEFGDGNNTEWPRNGSTNASIVIAKLHEKNAKRSTSIIIINVHHRTRSDNAKFSNTEVRIKVS